ncbi:MAG: PAS domain S-box protein [Desulfobulbaceae bacterium]|nr:PAS domain S-box protein [Desulfobulbaceae bacterium]HIJ89501.1 PAS domain S-box protein [Deltaproteobacteria bacterium]
MAEKPTYAELEQRVRELEERCSLFAAKVDSLVPDVGFFSRVLAKYQAGLEKLIAERTLDLQTTNAMLSSEMGRRLQLEEELSVSEKRYREFVEGTEDLVAQVDSQGKILFVNHAAQKIFGLTPEEAIGLSAFDFVHPEDRSETQMAFQDWLKERREVVVWGNRQLGRNGKTHFLHWTCNFHYDVNGTLLHINGIARDMTALHNAQEALWQANEEQERQIAEQTRELEEKVAELVDAIEKQKETEAELRESEERFRQIAENLTSVFWLRGLPAGQMLYISPAYETIWGRSCKSLYLNHDSWRDGVHPEDLDRLRTNHFYPNSRERVLEFRIIRADGVIRWIRAKIFVLCDQSGKEYREVGIAEDITHYMEVLDRLQESESRYRMIFESSTDGISIYELSKKKEEIRIVNCNTSYLGMAGRSKAELLSLSDIRIRKEARGETAGRSTLCPLYSVEPKERCEGMYSWVRPDGQRNFIECRGNRLSFKELEFMHCVHRDITQVKLAEEKIRHLSRRIIKSAEEEQKRIAGDLHDEFGQILPSLRHQVDALQKKVTSLGGGNSPEFTQVVAFIDKIGAAIRGATNRLRPDLLDTLGFVPALEWGLHDFAGRLPTIQTSMEISGAPRKILPEYEIALYRVVQEGLTNIGKHARAKNVAVRLIFSYPSLIVTVTDDGLGFDPACLSDLPSGAHGGIGLRGMHERMLAIGGTLSIRSRPGEGTTIRAEVRWLERGQEDSSIFMIKDGAYAELQHER